MANSSTSRWYFGRGGESVRELDSLHHSFILHRNQQIVDIAVDGMHKSEVVQSRFQDRGRVRHDVGRVDGHDIIDVDV